jgi:hypothetical protein
VPFANIIEGRYNMAEPQLVGKMFDFTKVLGSCFSKEPSNKNQYGIYGSSMTIMTIGRSLEKIDFDVLLSPAPRRKADGSQLTSFPGLDSESYCSIR